MIPSHVTVPEEYEQDALILLDELEINHQDVTYHQLDLIKNNPLLPSYNTALEELDLWQKINIWSNAPVVIHTENLTTSELVSKLPINSKEWRRFVRCVAEETAYEEDCDTEEIINKMAEPVSYEFKQTMAYIRENFRLDKLA